MRPRPDRRPADPPAPPALGAEAPPPVLTGRTALKTPFLILALALSAAPAFAQTITTEEDQRAYALVLPMFQEMFPGYPGQVLATCTVVHAQPAEKAALAAAPAPSAEIGQVVNGIIARPEAIGCVQRTLGI